jgi:signal peptidase I
MLGVVTGGLYAGCPFQLSVVRGDSMSPTLHNGELCLLDRDGFKDRPPKAGDVIVFRRGGEVLTKRVYGAPGETITLIRDRSEGTYEVPRAGQAKRLLHLQRWMAARDRPLVYRLVKLRIPAGHCFVLGDNRAHSVDSRVFGLVDLGSVIGRMISLTEMRPL